MPKFDAQTLFQPTILMALALMAIIVMMILPLPAWVLDIGLAASFALAYSLWWSRPAGEAWGLGGSRLFGEYQADVALGQNRIGISWQRLTRPDGVQIALESPAADPQGRPLIGAGLSTPAAPKSPGNQRAVQPEGRWGRGGPFTSQSGFPHRTGISRSLFKCQAQGARPDGDSEARAATLPMNWLIHGPIHCRYTN